MPQCTAHRRNSGGERCRGNAVAGTNVCRMHGGANPTVVQAGKRRLIQQKAAELLERLGDDVPPVEDPVGELAALLGRVRAVESALWAQLHDSPEPAALAVYGEHVDRLGKFLSEAVKLGLLDKAVAVQQAQAQKLADAFLETVREQRAWLSLLLTERGIAPTDAYNLTNDFERVSREKFAGRMRALPTESADR